MIAMNPCLTLFLLGFFAAIANASSASRLWLEGLTASQVRDQYCADNDDATECAVLVDLYMRTGGAAWRQRDGWLSRRSYCDWSHIDCEVGRLASM
jgi:hypothetical protein